MTGLEVGQRVRCRVPGRRSFEAVIVAVREVEQAVDVSDPRNGGRRTLHVELVKPARRRRTGTEGE